ncbi:unnamed protein product [Didymodactylos carnosus]|uniref:RRM domain-containing protein n=1 Tax=Didymodactylos carnosus TaxID=1234261 RepID=A0A814AX05_9BILA|nr:unnamed protein product [Didymodactylos carnosus]CAF3698131.1 unnamed protein product [Didymodactylos carnosus]
METKSLKDMNLPSYGTDRYLTLHIVCSSNGSSVISQELLEKYFSSYGRILEKRYHSSDITSLTFLECSTVDTILSQRPHYINDKLVCVRRRLPELNQYQTHELFLYDYSGKLSDLALKKYFQKYGTVQSFTQNKKKNCSYLTFVNKDEDIIDRILLELSNNNNEFKEECDNLRLKLYELMTTDHLLEKYDQLKEQHKCIKEELEQKTIELDMMKFLKQLYHDNNQENCTLKQDLENYKQYYIQLKNTNQRSHDENERYQDDIKNLQQINRQLYDELDKLKQETYDYQQRDSQSVNEEFEKLKQNYQQLLTIHQKSGIKSLQQENKQLYNELKQLKETGEQQEQHHKEKYDELKHDYDQVIINSQKCLQNNRDKIQLLREKQNNIQEELNLIKEQSLDQLRQLRTMTSAYELSTEVVKWLNDKIAVLEQERVQFREQFAELQQLYQLDSHDSINLLENEVISQTTTTTHHTVELHTPLLRHSDIYDDEIQQGPLLKKPKQSRSTITSVIVQHQQDDKLEERCLSGPHTPPLSPCTSVISVKNVKPSSNKLPKLKSSKSSITITHKSCKPLIIPASHKQSKLTGGKVRSNKVLKKLRRRPIAVKSYDKPKVLQEFYKWYYDNPFGKCDLIKEFQLCLCLSKQDNKYVPLKYNGKRTIDDYCREYGIYTKQPIEMWLMERGEFQQNHSIGQDH